MKQLLLLVIAVLTLLLQELGVAQGSTNALVVLSATTRSQVESAISSITSKGGQVRHVFDGQILLCYIPTANDNYVAQSPYVAKMLRGTVDPSQFTTKLSQHAAAAFN